jgi:hypothetical protein
MRYGLLYYFHRKSRKEFDGEMKERERERGETKRQRSWYLYTNLVMILIPVYL